MPLDSAYFNWPAIKDYQISSGDIHLWMLRLPQEVATARFEKNHQFKQDRRRILEMILTKYCPQGFKIQQHHTGKPYMDNHVVEFSTSHSGAYLVIALATSAIGVDIERFKIRDYADFGERFFGKQWYQKKLASIHPFLHGLLFFKQWSLTEAWVKALGQSIFNYPQISTAHHTFLSFNPRIGLIGALCLKGNIQKIYKTELDWHSLSSYQQGINEAYTLYFQKHLQAPNLTVHFMNEINSTQTYLKTQKLPFGIHICHAEAQTDGKGRLGRHWKSSTGQNILCSILYPVKKSIRQCEGLSLVIGLAIANVFKKLLKVKVQVKWPNDIYYQEKKLAGILIELLTREKNSCQLLIGFGINVNESQKTLLASATSLYEMTHKKQDRRHLLQALIIEIHQHLQVFQSQGLAAFLEQWQRYDLLANRQVEVLQFNQKIVGMAKGINQKGNLIIEDGDEVFHEVGFGEVSIQSFSKTEKD